MSVDFVLWLQSFASPFADSLFTWVTRLGNESFYLLAIPFVYWVLDKRQGLRLAMVFLFSFFINSALKDALRLPRPSPAEVRVVYPESGTGYGFPSGHAQGNTVFWGYLAMSYRRTRFLLPLAVVIIILVSLSRMYLGLHFPLDVAGGIVLGLAVLAAFFLADHLLSGQSISFELKAAAAVLLPLGLLVFYRSPDGIKGVGFLIGLALGYLLESRYVGWSHRATLAQNAIKLAIGYAVFFAFQELSRPFFPEGMAQLIRYGLSGLWATLVAPFLFQRLRLYSQRYSIPTGF